MNAREFFRAFKPHIAKVPVAEKFRSGLAGGLAILLLGLALHTLPQTHYALLMLGSIAASTVLLFAAPHSPMAQPWNLIVGHLVSGLIGWCCALLTPDPVLAGALAVGSAIFAMHLLDALHPPGAATALTMVLSNTVYHDMGALWAFYIVFANAGISLLLALSINNLLPGRRYPARPAITPPAPPTPVEIEMSDIEQAVDSLDGVIDISQEDLSEIYRRARQHAQQRYENALKKK